MKITCIEPTVAIFTPKKKVAAYACVSMESDRLNHSLSVQFGYYSNLSSRGILRRFMQGCMPTAVSRAEGFVAGQNSSVWSRTVMPGKSTSFCARVFQDLPEKHGRHVGNCATSEIPRH